MGRERGGNPLFILSEVYWSQNRMDILLLTLTKQVSLAIIVIEELYGIHPYIIEELTK